ncbi:hypothetical protein KJ877_04925 [bacterium]|nr:hypothetical protein [bacterium]MBU1990429.1 hypothetical protein [bacterium]
MKNIQRTTFSALITLILSTPLFANEKGIADTSLFKPDFTFGNISLNYLDWTQDTQNRSPQRDFSYLELEGGAGWSWGEFYMLADLENPTRSYDDTTDSRHYVFKPVLDIRLLKTNFHIHIQDYNFYSENFYVSNAIAGLSYKIESGSDFWAIPFIGIHHQQSTYYTGFNGFMAGFSHSYSMHKQNNKFSIAGWHEFEFGRNKKDYQLEDGTPIGDGDSYGVQGALSFWWHPRTEVTTGVQYRYAHNKLGFNGYQDGFIYSVKYNF